MRPTEPDRLALSALAPALAAMIVSACAGTQHASPGDAARLGDSSFGIRDAAVSVDSNVADVGPRSPRDADSAADGDQATGILDDCPLMTPSFDGGAQPDGGCVGEVTDAGGCLVLLATQQDHPTGLAVRGDNVVWGNCPSAESAASIVRVGSRGGTPVTLASQFYVFAYDAIGLTLDDTHVYWVSEGVTRVPLAGGAAETLYNDDNSDVLAPVRAGGNVYFVESQGNYGLFSVSTTGTGFTHLSAYAEVADVSSTSTGLVYSVASDEEGVPGQLISLPCGGTPTTLYTEPSGDLGLVASAGDVVVFIKGDVGVGDLMSIPLAGGTPSFLASGVYADSLATDGVAVYWTDEGLQAVMKLDLASGAPVVLAPYDGIRSILGLHALVLDPTSIYWTSPSACSGTCGGAILKLTPR